MTAPLFLVEFYLESNADMEVVLHTIDYIDSIQAQIKLTKSIF